MAPTTEYQWTPSPTTPNANALQRPFGPSEYAFYPASLDGLGDMFLHLAFRAPSAALDNARIVHAWAVIRNRHPLLACKVKVEVEGGGETPCPHFEFTPPADTSAALAEAREALYFRHETKNELIDDYMNGPRTLSNDQLSYLVISTPGSGAGAEEDQDQDQDYDLLMCAPHFTGDGTSLHQATHDLLALLAAPPPLPLPELDLHSDWATRLPLPFEARCTHIPDGRFARAAARVNYIQTRAREIGGHAFARASTSGGTRTVLRERVYTEAETQEALGRCRTRGVTVNHAVEAACGVAWGRVVLARNANPGEGTEKLKDPVMVYTAINLRPHLSPRAEETYWFLALTYFTLVLPAFPPPRCGPSGNSTTFWLRARSAKSQTQRAVQSPLLVHRALEMASERAARARGRQPVSIQNVMAPGSQPTAPSTALVGLSLIGNLDRTYVRTAYAAFELREVTTASRQKRGGCLLLVHTFGGRLWMQLFFDLAGEGGSDVEAFWDEVCRVVDEFLIS